MADFVKPSLRLIHLVFLLTAVSATIDFTYRLRNEERDLVDHLVLKKDDLFHSQILLGYIEFSADPTNIKEVQYDVDYIGFHDLFMDFYPITTTPFESTFEILIDFIIVSPPLEESNQIELELHVCAHAAVEEDSVPDCKDVRVPLTLEEETFDPIQFEKREYFFSISENIEPGDTVGFVNAFAVGNKPNSQITYTIRDTDILRSDVFNIDYMSGKIFTTRLLDFEQESSYSFEVQARNGPMTDPSAKNAEIIVNVNILDEHDNQPTFVQDVYHFSVSENVGVGHIIGQVTARDYDTQDNGRVTYLLEDLENAFSIDSNTGIIEVKQQLDYEINNFHTLQVLAIDHNLNIQFTSSVEVVIEVLDENDNSPVFSQPIYSFTVSDNADINAPIGEIHALDQDSGENGLVSFSFQYPIMEETFYLDPLVPGSVFIRSLNQLDPNIQEFYSFELFARDNGIPSRSSSVNVQISVLKSNSPPESPSNSVEFMIPSFLHVGDSVGIVRNPDENSCSNGQVHFLIKESPCSNVPFVIDAGTGELTITASLMPRKYDFTVIVVKNDDPEYERVVPVKVIVM